jgi:hypothetical protein
MKKVPEKVAKIYTEGGQKLDTEKGTRIENERRKEHRTTEEEMEGHTSS